MTDIYIDGPPTVEDIRWVSGIFQSLEMTYDFRNLPTVMGVEPVGDGETCRPFLDVGA